MQYKYNKRTHANCTTHVAYIARRQYTQYVHRTRTVCVAAIFLFFSFFREKKKLGVNV